MKNNYFILPRGKHSAICTLKNKEIVEVAPVSFPAGSYFAIAEKWIACITQKGRKISLLKIAENNKFAPYPAIILPKKYHADAIAIVDNTLFVGGVCGNEILGRYDLSTESPTWVSLEIPEQLKRFGKSIDDLLIDGDRLIAVDNMVFPKWLLLYDISKPDSPQLCSYPELENHGTYEKIRMGALGLNWVALLSSSTGMVGSCTYISLMKKNELIEKIVITRKPQPRLPYIPLEDDDYPYFRWEKICFLDDVLLIAAYKGGVGVLDLTEAPYAEKPIYHFPESVSGNSVIDFVPVPLTKEVIIISTDSKETFFTVISKNDFL